MSRTGLTFVIDSNVVDDLSPSALELRSLHRDAWINLTRTDTLDTELDTAPSSRRDDLLRASSEYVEHAGPAVWGESRWGHAVWAAPEDTARLDKVAAVLYPGLQRHQVTSNNLRDCMHVATAVRYGAHGFITNDRRLLNKATAMRAAFNDFVLCNPEAALTIAKRFVERARRR